MPKYFSTFVCNKEDIHLINSDKHCFKPLH